MTITEPSNQDLGDTPDSVREYIHGLERELIKQTNFAKSGRTIASDLKAQIEQLKAERDGIAARYAVMYLSAKGLSYGVDWNKGTHALKHGHRDRLIECVNGDDAASKIVEKLKLEQQAKGAGFYGEKLAEMGFDGVAETTRKVIKQLRQQAEGLE